MVQFNELRITHDKNNLIIEVQVIDHEFYENVYIDSISIDNQRTYLGKQPSEDVVYTYEHPEDSNDKLLRLTISSEELPLIGNLFFVYVTTKGAPHVDTPSDLANVRTLDVVTDLQPIYEAVLKIASQVEETCDGDDKLVDLILKINALDLTLKTSNYPLAIKYWNKYFNPERLRLITTKCDQK